MRTLPNRRSASLLSAALLLAAGPAVAAPFSYDYIEGSFGEVSDASDADGIYLGGAKSLDPKFGLLGSLGIIDYRGGDGLVLRGGGLFHTPLQSNLDLVGTLELVYSDFDFNHPVWGRYENDDIGLAAGLGLRFELQDNFQLEGKVTMADVDPFDDGLGLMAGARYYLDKQLSAAAGVASDAEFDGIWLNIRYELN